ncbi:hypothetical protein IAR55_003927 [Kwoniella newhampshirensis]|uniref:BTB domain-containing protein n=1 Tax=Kwoniella newhampshirensis TaxID=1651941 RepID=A0AAW0YW23_9TREE
MTTSNPSHLLISRNPPRSPAHPQLAPTSTSRHGHLTSPRPAILGRWHHSADELTSPGGHDRLIPETFDGRALPKGHTGLRHMERDGRGWEGGRDELSREDVEEVIEVHPTFLPDSTMPGNVKVIVGRNEFWCHKEILWFASPFFQGLLEGNWAETTQVDAVSVLSSSSYRQSSTVSIQSPSSPPTDTDPPSPVHPAQGQPGYISPTRPPLTQRDSAHHLSRSPPRQQEDDTEEEKYDTDSNVSDEGRKGSVYLDATEEGPTIADILKELRELPETPLGGVRSIADDLDEHTPTLSEVVAQSKPAYPQPSSHPSSHPPPEAKDEQGSNAWTQTHRSVYRPSFSSSIRPLRASATRARGGSAEAVVELHEESVSAFQDFLFWAYPHLECRVTWTNVENLLALSSKLIVSALQKLCEHFLLTHASGRPVMALSLAEEHGNAELYREASRFVLDQPTWDATEMETLSEQTQLKLSKRRNWFLERLLKLGSIDVKKEYSCRPDCPDPTRCQIQLDEKWRQAHSAVCRYGPPQPSVAFRCLRQLETFPTNPSLVMPHPSCQSAAKSWVMSLFDRMFQPKLVSSNPGTEKYWLWISMN